MSSLLNEAIAAHRTGNLTGAEKLYREFLTNNPAHPDGLALLGVLLGDKGDFAAAEASLRQAIAADPQAGLFPFYLGTLLAKTTQQREAAAAFRQAVTLQPDFGAAWLGLCRAAEQSGDIAQSIEAGQKATTLLPQDASAFFAAGTALSRAERHDEAALCFQTATRLHPDWVEAWDNLGLSLHFAHAFTEAETAFRTMISLSGQTIPDELLRSADERKIGGSHWHLARLELSMGDYERGFARGRCRLNANGWLDHAELNVPLWRGEDIAGKTLLIHAEGGSGDTILMARYLPLIRARGIRTVFYVKPETAPLFRGWNGVDEIRLWGEPLGSFDRFIWAWELPFAFGTRQDTVPAKLPYLPLLPPDEKTTLPASPKGQPRIGLIWSGNTERSRIPLQELAPLIEIPYAFYSLTRDKQPGDDALLSRFSVTDLAPRQKDFGDLARQIAQMDLLISCDTAAPQLAAAMGRNAWVLLPHACDWRWGIEGDESPWFPGTRLFRQPRPGDWPAVNAQVKEALTRL